MEALPFSKRVFSRICGWAEGDPGVFWGALGAPQSPWAGRPGGLSRAEGICPPETIQGGVRLESLKKP